MRVDCDTVCPEPSRRTRRQGRVTRTRGWTRRRCHTADINGPLAPTEQASRRDLTEESLVEAQAAPLILARFGRENMRAEILPSAQRTTLDAKLFDQDCWELHARITASYTARPSATCALLQGVRAGRTRRHTTPLGNERSRLQARVRQAQTSGHDSVDITCTGEEQSCSHGWVG